MRRFLSQDRAFEVAGIGDAVLLSVAGQHQGQRAVTGHIAGGAEAVLQGEDSQHQSRTGVVEHQNTGDQTQRSHDSAAGHAGCADSEDAEQIMRRIVLPQALRTAVPALSNSLIGMIKDTSLASNITVAELFMAGQRVAARTYIFLPIYCEVAVVYLLFCTVITKLQALLERQLNARGFQ